MRLPFSPVTVLIGSDNSAKTSALTALDLALAYYSRYVTEKDFHVGADAQDNEAGADEIIVDF